MYNRLRHNSVFLWCISVRATRTCVCAVLVRVSMRPIMCKLQELKLKYFANTACVGNYIVL